MEITKEIKQKIEGRISTLTGQQGEVFTKKKADRDAAALATIREELNSLKAIAGKVYRNRELSQEEQTRIQAL